MFCAARGTETTEPFTSLKAQKQTVMQIYGISFRLQIPPVVCKATTIESRNSSEVPVHERWYTLQTEIRQKNKNSLSISLQCGQPAFSLQTFLTHYTFSPRFFAYMLLNGALPTTNRSTFNINPRLFWSDSYWFSQNMRHFFPHIKILPHASRAIAYFV